MVESECINKSAEILLEFDLKHTLQFVLSTAKFTPAFSESWVMLTTVPLGQCAHLYGKPRGAILVNTA